MDKEIRDCNGYQLVPINSQMSRRDYFIAAALIGVLSNKNCDNPNTISVARDAILTADEIIRQLEE